MGYSNILWDLLFSKKLNDKRKKSSFWWNLLNIKQYTLTVLWICAIPSDVPDSQWCSFNLLSLCLLMPLSTDPAPQAVYSSAYPQGSSVFQNKITTMGIWMSTHSVCRKQTALFCIYTNIRILG